MAFHPAAPMDAMLLYTTGAPPPHRGAVAAFFLGATLVLRMSYHPGPDIHHVRGFEHLKNWEKSRLRCVRNLIFSLGLRMEAVRGYIFKHVSARGSSPHWCLLCCSLALPFHFRRIQSLHPPTLC